MDYFYEIEIYKDYSLSNIGLIMIRFISYNFQYGEGIHKGYREYSKVWKYTKAPETVLKEFIEIRL